MILTTHMKTFFYFFVAKESRVLHTLFRAVNMHYSESNDWIDVVLLVQEMAFIYNLCAAFKKCKMVNFKTDENQSGLSRLRLTLLLSKIFNDSFSYQQENSYKIFQEHTNAFSQTLHLGP